MHLPLAKRVAGNEPVIIAADVEHLAVAAVAQQVGCAEGL